MKKEYDFSNAQKNPYANREKQQITINLNQSTIQYFKDLADVQKSFRAFAELSSGDVLANGDDLHTAEALEGLSYVSFGLKEHNRVRAVNMCPDWRSFDVECDGKHYCHLHLEVIGKHNAMNALAAAGAAWLLGIPSDAVEHGLESFHGARRRMEYKGEFNGAQVYDDYAHHPDELAATIAAVRTMPECKRMVVAFQPHTYTRTKALFEEFVRELKKPDVVVLAEIYAARESNTVGVSSADLAEQIPGALFCETLPEVTARLKEIIREGDVVITMGAGDIFRAGEALLKE